MQAREGSSRKELLRGWHLHKRNQVEAPKGASPVVLRHLHYAEGSVSAATVNERVYLEGTRRPPKG